MLTPRFLGRAIASRIRGSDWSVRLRPEADLHRRSSEAASKPGLTRPRPAVSESEGCRRTRRSSGPGARPAGRLEQNTVLPESMTVKLIGDEVVANRAPGLSAHRRIGATWAIEP